MARGFVARLKKPNVRVLTPTKLTRDQRKLLEQLGATLKVDNKPADRNSSIFHRVKDIFR